MKALIILFVCFSSTAQRSATIDSGDSKLHYKIFGAGSPILLINGGPGMDSEGFEPLAKQLSANNSVILYDQRGTGKSTCKIGSETITMDKMTGDIETLRTHLGFENWIVLGHSFGGMLASYYASLHPQRISKLILSSSGGIDLELLDYVNRNIQSKLSDTERDSLSYYNQKIANGDTSYRTRLGRGRALAPAYVYDKRNAERIAERLTRGNSTLNGLVWDNLRRIKFNCAPKLKSFTKPVLILHGKNDILKLETAIKSKNAFSNAKLIEIDNCAHYGWLDNPTAYLKCIRDFLIS